MIAGGVGDFWEKIVKGVSYIISYGKSKIVTVCGDIPDLEKLDKMEEEIVKKWFMSVAQYLNNHKGKFPDEKEYKVKEMDSLDNLIRNLEESVEKKRRELGIK